MPGPGSYAVGCLRFAAAALLLLLFSSGDQLRADEPPLHERIDALVEAASLGPNAAACSDANFLRRVYLDLNGTIPDAEATRAFLDDESPDKRAALVDRLLARPEFARHMATKFDVMWMERRRQRRLPGKEWTITDDQWREFLRSSFAENKPLNQLAREILSADGVDPALRPAVKWYLDRDAAPDLLARDIGRLFFGRDLQCAQCHDHPLIDDYHQADYYGLKAFVDRGVLFDDKKEKKLYYAEKADGEVTFKSVFTGTGRDYVLPKLPTGAPMSEPVLAKGEAYVVAPAKGVRPIPKYSRRAQLAALATDGSNRAFNRNLANRLWAIMMGRGVTHPLDMLHSDNPAIESRLLDLLAGELVKMKFDVRAFLRELALTRTYGRTSELPSADDLPVDPEAGASELAAWKVEADRIAKELPNLEEAYGTAAAEYDTAYDGFAEASKAREAADKTHAEAKKASDEVSAALATAVKDVETKEPIVKALVEARVKADAAVAKLPDDKELTAAAALYKKRANEVDTQLAAARKTVKEKTPQVQAASLKLAEVDKSVQAAEAKVTTARAALETAEAKARETRLKFRETKSRHGELTARIDEGQAVLDYVALAGTAAESQAALDAANEAYKQVHAQESATAEEINRVEEAGLAAAEKAVLDREAARSAWNKLADNATVRFTLAPLKALSPEQLAWATMQAVGIVDQQRAALADEAKKEAAAKKDLSDDERAAEEARILEAKVYEKLRGKVGPFVSLFGQEPGQPATFQSTVHQALFLTNGGVLADWLNPGGNNLTERLSKMEQPDQVADELYVTVLTRRPTDEEKQQVADYWAAGKDDRAAAAREMVWALLTSTEFRFNH